MRGSEDLRYAKVCPHAEKTGGMMTEFSVENKFRSLLASSFSNRGRFLWMMILG